MEYMEDPEEFIEDEENFDDDEINEDFDEFEYEDDCGDDECDLPKCAKPKKVSLTSLAGLKKHFDEVLLERTQSCNLLTLRDKDVIVWKLTFVQALEKAYELFGPQKPKQLDIFDFLAA